MSDRITELRIEGMRCIETLRLKLGGLTVLIGDNGSGKSTVIEACELLRCAPAWSLSQLVGEHGGFLDVLRSGARALTLGVRLEGAGTPPLEYVFSVAPRGNATEIVKEQLLVDSGDPSVRTTHGHPDCILDRNLTAGGPGGNHPLGAQSQWAAANPDRSLFSFYGENPPDPRIGRMRQALENIEVHVPFETVANWAAPDARRGSTLRSEQRLATARRLDRHATNLVNAYHALRNRGEEEWRETMEYVRLGLGPQVESVQTLPSASGGASALSLKLRNGNGQVLASQLSDGTLAYLAFVAVFRLEPPTSLLAFDEPDLHLHPQLLMRVLDFMESAAEDHPVLVATHSDRLLDGLSDPVGSVVLCELDERRATRLRRPDKAALDAWLERYRGLGDVRAAGHESSVMTLDPDGRPTG